MKKCDTCKRELENDWGTRCAACTSVQNTLDTLVAELKSRAAGLPVYSTPDRLAAELAELARYTLFAAESAEIELENIERGYV